MALGVRITIRVTEEDRDRLMREAQAENREFSSFLRQRLGVSNNVPRTTPEKQPVSADEVQAAIKVDHDRYDDLVRRYSMQMSTTNAERKARAEVEER